MQIPKKITPCPILEAILEIRFEPEEPDDAIFGIIYNKFKKRFPKLEKLPILQIPDQFRSRDPNLIYKPHYKLIKENFLVQVGPRIFSLVNVKNYSGWDKFSQEIREVFELLSKLQVIKEIKRLGLRYVNLFENFNIYEKSNLKLLLKDVALIENPINLTTRIASTSNEFVNQLVMVNDANVAVDNISYEGSLIDIDTNLEPFPESAKTNFNEFIDIIERAHEEEKKLFFSLLEDDYLKKLNPEY
jgi:uncharacterized protein (TIGR04255 family)